MLKNVIMKDLIRAMKEKNKVKKGVLQLVKAGLENAEKDKKRPLKPDEEIQIIQKEIKQTKESLKEAERFGRQDLISETKEKLKILSSYLPDQLDEGEVKERLIALGIGPGMNMGEAMKKAITALAGKAENALIAKVVKHLISQ